MIIVDVGEHEVIVVAKLIVDIFIPIFALFGNTEYTCAFLSCIKVRSIEMLIVPFKGGVLVSPTRKIKLGPTLDLKRLRYLLHSIIRIDLNNWEYFLLVRTCFMIHH
ncbi:hypothetical protein D3C75_1079580 [compost metagenome]